jgi:hypothetical protein
MNVAEILKEVREDFTHKYANPVDRLKSNSDKALRYSELLFRVNRQKNRQKIAVDKKYSELYKSAKFDNHLLLKNKQDIEAQIDTNEEYTKMKNDLKEWENLAQMLENLVDIYRQREASERLIFKAETGIGG